MLQWQAYQLSNKVMLFEATFIEQWVRGMKRDHDKGAIVLK